MPKTLTITARQAQFASWTMYVLIDIVVLNLFVEFADTIVDRGPEGEAARAAYEQVPRADRPGIQEVEGSAVDHDHVLTAAAG